MLKYAILILAWRLVSQVSANQYCYDDYPCVSIFQTCNTSISTCVDVYCDGHENCTSISSSSICNDNNTCSCLKGYSQQNGQCTKVLGRACINSNDCGMDRYMCSDGTCVCDIDWYQQDGVCVPFLGKGCNTSIECIHDQSFWPYDYKLWCDDGTCKCKPGYKTEEDGCTQVLSSICHTDDDCPLDYAECNGYCRCKHGTHASYPDQICIPTLGSSCAEVYCDSYLNQQCNADNVCTCKIGFIEDPFNCVQVYDRPCQIKEDCGLYSLYDCSTEGICTCASGSIEMISNNGYRTCSSGINLPCNQSYCNQSNAGCTEDGICECEYGYFDVYGACINVLGAPCVRDETCKVLDNTRCSRDNHCQCKDGFKMSNDICVKVLHSTCTSVQECPTKDSSCINGQCTCTNEAVEFNDICLRPHCAYDVAKINDLHRRGTNYKARYQQNEHLVDDSYLAEGWYSLGVYSLATHNPGEGYCGTFHPIYLKEKLSIIQLEQMEHGEVEVQAFVGEANDLITTKLRKCGDETQLYVPTGVPRFSAFCIERNLTSYELSSEYPGYYAYINTELKFTDILKEDKLWRMPYVLFHCYTYIHDYSDEHQYVINWYADNKHIITNGPVIRRSFNDRNKVIALNENTLLARGYKVGVNDHNYWRFQGAGENNMTRIYLNHGIPLGCASELSDNSLNCRFTFGLSGGTCSESFTSSTDHPLCGITIMGKTFKYNDTYGNGVYENNNTYFTNVVVTDPLEEYNTDAFLRLAFEAKAVNVGHKMWENYTLPLQTEYVMSYTNNLHLYAFSHSPNNVPILEISGTNYHTRLTFDIVGEFILLHETSERPFQVQVQTENCKDDIYAVTICFCAITVINGNDISTYSVCGGNLKNGYYKTRNTQPTDFQATYTSSGIRFNVNPHFYQQSTHLTIDAALKKSTNFEGILSARYEYYRWRSGAVFSHDEGFINSWRIEYDESLHNPINHVSYAWRDTFYQCTCPDSSDNIIDSGHTDGWYNYETIGAVKCSSQNICSEDQEGKEWPGSLLPSYYIDTVAVSSRMQIDDNSATLEFRCIFRTAVGYFYNVYWYHDDILLKTCNAKSSSSASDCTLTGDEVLVYNNTLFVLDIKMSCGTEVLSSDGSILLNVLKSHKSVVPVETADRLKSQFKNEHVLSENPDQQSNQKRVHTLESFYPNIPNTEIIISRGGDTTLTLKKNIDFVASPSKEWTWEFTVYDLDDPNCTCKDSSIAIRSSSGDICGVRLSTSYPWSSDTTRITLTTKNNNKYTLKDTFRLKLRTALKVKGQRLLNGAFSSDITMFVSDEEFWKRKVCFSNNDPQMKTFDGTYWYLKHGGIFVMYRHKQLPIEVQLLVQTCNGGWATCSCGVIVRAERDLFIINHCHEDHMTGWITPEYSEPRTFSPRQLDSSRYQFYLPHGTQVDVSVSPWRWYLVNVNIFASPSDVNNVDGLCGEFNNNPADDFTSRDGTVDYSEDNRDWWWSWWRYDPDVFPKSWQLAGQWENESLLDPNNIDNLPVNNKTDILCVCPWNHDSEASICSANEAETCTENLGLPGEDLSRKRRSIRSDGRQYFDLDQRLGEVRSKFNKRSNSLISKRSVKRSVNISNDEALEMCSTMLNQDCPAYARKEELVEADANGTLLNCAADTAFNPNISWSGESCSRMVVIAEMESKKDTDNENANKTETLIKELCVGNCSGQGVCVDGKCKCNPGFLTDICFIDSSIPPTISRVFGNGVCNPTTDMCDCISLVTSGNAETTTCNMTILQASANQTFDVVTSQFATANMHSLNEALCCYEFGSTRRKRSTEQEITGYSVILSLSNNNETFGNSKQVFIIDTQCLEVDQISGQDVLKLKSGYCYIEGTCYAEGRKDETECSECDPMTNTYTWTDTCVKQKHDDDDDNTQLILIACVAAVVGVGLVLCLSFFARMVYKSKRSKKIHAETDFVPERDYPMDMFQRGKPQ